MLRQVALFVAGEAFSDTNLQAQAKMGALLSLLAAPIALGMGRALRVQDGVAKPERTRQRTRQQRTLRRGLSLANVGEHHLDEGEESEEGPTLTELIAHVDDGDDDSKVY